MFQLLSTDLFDNEVNWSYVDGSDAGLIISRGSCDFPEEVHICGETNLIADGYYSQHACLLYTSPSPRDGLLSRMPSSA